MNSTEAIRIVGFIESPMSLVRDCLSIDPARKFYCGMSHFIGSMSGILMPAVVLIGLVGNVIVAKVMLTDMRSSRQNLYLGCIAMADCLNLLITGILHGFLSKGLSWLTRGHYGFYLYNLSEVWCKFCRYSVNFCQLLACLWLLLLVADRAWAIYRPLASMQYRRQSAIRALVATFLVSLVATLPTGALVRHMQVMVSERAAMIYCYRMDEPFARWTMLFYSSLVSNPPTLPILVMLLLNVFLVKRVLAAMRNRRSLQGELNRTQRATVDDLNGTILVVILAIIYLVLYLPVLIFHPMLDAAMETLKVADHIDYLLLLANIVYASKALALLNQTTNVFVLLKRSAEFRRAVGAMVCFRACRRCCGAASADRKTLSCYRLSEMPGSSEKKI